MLERFINYSPYAWKCNTLKWSNLFCLQHQNQKRVHSTPDRMYSSSNYSSIWVAMQSVFSLDAEKERCNTQNKRGDSKQGNPTYFMLLSTKPSSGKVLGVSWSPCYPVMPEDYGFYSLVFYILWGELTWIKYSPFLNSKQLAQDNPHLSCNRIYPINISKLLPQINFWLNTLAIRICYQLSII